MSRAAGESRNPRFRQDFQALGWFRLDSSGESGITSFPPYLPVLLERVRLLHYLFLVGLVVSIPEVRYGRHRQSSPRRRKKAWVTGSAHLRPIGVAESKQTD